MPFVRTAVPRLHPATAYAMRVRRAAKSRGRGLSQGGDTFVDPSTGIEYDLSTMQPIVDSSGNPVVVGPSVTLPTTTPTVTTPPPSPSTPSSSSGGGGLTAQQIAQLFSSAAQGAVNIFKATSNPSLVPGTQAVYNPATGQFYNPVTGQVVQPTGPSAGISLAGMNTTPLLIGGGLLIGGLILMSFMKGR